MNNLKKRKKKNQEKKTTHDDVCLDLFLILKNLDVHPFALLS